MRNFGPMMALDLKNRKLVFLLAGGLLVRFILAWLPEKYLFYLVGDDAYYYFSIAKNFVTRGMFSADGITPTNGFHPLWLFVITPIYLFFKNFPWFSIHLALTLSAWLDTAAAFLIYKTLEKLGREKTGFWAAAFYLANPYGLVQTMNGLEIAQNNFFLAFLVYLSVRAAPEWLKTGWFYLGTVSGLTLLSRTDNIFAVGSLFVFLFWRSRNFDALARAGTAASLLVLPWLVYNFLTFGSIVQTSGWAYSFYYHQQYLNEFHSFFSAALIPFLAKSVFHTFAENAFHYGNWILSLILGGILFFRLGKWPHQYRPLLWVLAGAGLFLAFHVLFRWSLRPWYPQAVFVLTLPLVALALESIPRHIAGAGAVLALLLAGNSISKWKFRIADRSPIMLEIINRKIPPSDRVGVFNSGYLQYFTDQKVINLDGLVNNEVLSYYKKRKGLEYFYKKKIRWLLDTPSYLGGIFGPYFGPAAESLLAIADMVEGIAYPTNNVVLLEISADGLHPPPGGKTPFRHMIEGWRDRSFYRRWGPVPLLN